MRGGIPLVVPLVWTCPGVFFLRVATFCVEIGSDCLRHLEALR